MNFLKRLIVIGVMAGFAALALFTASEMNNIAATSDKGLVLLVLGTPVVVGLLLLRFLGWPEYFAFSNVLFLLSAIFVMALAILDAMPLRGFYNLVTGFSPDFFGRDSGYVLELEVRSLLATVKGTLYILAIVSLAAFVLLGAYRGLVPLAEDPAPPPRNPKRGAVIFGAVALVLLGLAFFNYVNVGADRAAVEEAIRAETAPAVEN